MYIIITQIFKIVKNNRCKAPRRQNMSEMFEEAGKILATELAAKIADDPEAALECAGEAVCFALDTAADAVKLAGDLAVDIIDGIGSLFD
jgi:hypothetical protein